MATTTKNKSQLLKFLFPLIFFGVALLAVGGYFQHKKLLERTRITFNAQSPDFDLTLLPSAWLDGKQVSSGDKISLGKHALKFTHPRGDAFETNFSAWYGGKDLGTIALKRSTGKLNIHASRPMIALNITGGDFGVVLTNLTEKTLTVPTEDYTVMAWFPNRPAETKKVSVVAGQTSDCSFAPEYGALHASANRDDVAYELTDAAGKTMLKGNLPVANGDVPVGTYRLATTWHSHTAEKRVEVKNGETSEAAFDFSFGAAVLRTEPSGATVYGMDGARLGETPLLVVEVPPGPVEYRLRLSGYEEVAVALTVAANQTNSVSTNLVSLVYLSEMQRGREYMTVSNYTDAVSAFAEALKAKPGDAQVLEEGRKANLRATVEAAKALAGQGDYIGAGQRLKSALGAFPDDAEAKALLPIYQSHEAEQNALTREQHVRFLFEREWRNNPLGTLFDANEYVTARMSPQEARDALVKSYASEWPKAVATVNKSLEDGVYGVWLDQSASGSDAKRDMLVVFGKSKDDKTLILFKNIEFQMGNYGDWVPLHSSKIQMTEAYTEQVKVGVRMMLRKIKLAIGETDKY